MKQIICSGCGSNEFQEKLGHSVCIYCQTKYVAAVQIGDANETVIAIHSDIAILLDKCRRDPVNARRYANLILDLDPSNAEARNYLH